MNHACFSMMAGIVLLCVTHAQDKKPANHALRLELIAMAELDQKMMTDPILNPPGRDFRERIDKVKRKHNGRLRQILEQHGWLGHNEVGNDGCSALLLLAQHADEDVPLQKLCLVKLKEAVARGEPYKENLALLTDRILVNTGQKQLYGTQIEYGEKGPAPKAVEDASGLNARRKEMGLEPIEDYLERIKAVNAKLNQQLTQSKTPEPTLHKEQDLSYQSRTHRDGDDKKWQVEFRERILHPDGAITIRSRGVNHDSNFSQAERSYTPAGEPIYSSQLGTWGKLEATFAPDQVTRLINGKKDVQKIDRKTLIDPTLFWFWKTTPKEGESVVVTFAAANVPSTFQIRFTYQGTEELEAVGRTVKAHKVREEPLSVKPGNDVFTLRWFDEKGMEIKRYHKVNHNVYETNLLYWK